MNTVTLSRALRSIKRMKERIAKVGANIQASNSTPKVNKRQWDVNALLEERKALTVNLVKFKLVLADATRPIMPLILEIAEIKGEITLLQGISTVEGFVHQSYGDSPPVEYTAILTAPEIEKRVTVLQGRIDELQQKIDHHNATTMVDIDE